ncbi:MAG: PadR family transcriptional regulator [Ectothiorhodospiraceae bacterium]|nr:PadR family transcriptional regulator [Ectothiorhodospiraceae bacterium]MCH8506327.1 PadR family transcriptional regulator [Ectothiorhodospiraceae bacterium]
MSLRYALLAALHESPATGYELTQRFRHRLAHVWNASHQQIYRELGKLHEEGLLTMTEVPQTEKPDRKLYQVTAEGEQDLRTWLTRPQPRPPTRDPLLVKLFAGDLLDLPALRAEMERLRMGWEQQLQTFQAIEQEHFSAPETLPQHYRMQHLALRRGILGIQASLRWLEEMEETLDQDN